MKTKHAFSLLPSFKTKQLEKSILSAITSDVVVLKFYLDSML